MEFSAYVKLGEEIGEAWHVANRDELAFPDIAYKALSAFEPGELSIGAIGQFLLSTHIKQQPELKFSELPVVVYRGDGFYLECLVWTESTTTIHQHGFSGAFRILSGSSLHGEYRFQVRERKSSRLLLGDIECEKMQHLCEGEVRRIHSGRDGLIHSLFHLDRPSITLVARTNHDPESGLQYNLYRPRFAFDREWAQGDSRVVTITRWLGLQEKLAEDDQLKGILSELAKLDLPRIVGLLLANVETFSRPGIARQWHSLLSNHFGQNLADDLRELVSERKRKTSLMKVRKHVSDPDLRFFIALLLNGSRRTDVFDEMQWIFGPIFS